MLYSGLGSLIAHNFRYYSILGNILQTFYFPIHNRIPYRTNPLLSDAFSKILSNITDKTES